MQIKMSVTCCFVRFSFLSMLDLVVWWHATMVVQPPLSPVMPLIWYSGVPSGP
jgi:hypothetical protein